MDGDIAQSIAVAAAFTAPTFSYTNSIHTSLASDTFGIRVALIASVLGFVTEYQSVVYGLARVQILMTGSLKARLLAIAEHTIVAVSI